LSSVELARRGHRVFATLRDLEKAGPLREAAARAGVTLEVLALDVTRPDSIAHAIEEVLARVGRIDVLVNNAGFGMGGFLEDVSLEELREQFETNFFGLVAMTKAVLPAMREQRHGKIVNVSSISGRLAAPGLSAYCASKWAVEGISESLRHELRQHGIWVTLIEPGTFKTDIQGKNRRIAARALDPSSPNYQAMQAGMRVIDKMLARNRQDPQWVADAIADAVDAERPPLRRLVGRDALGEAVVKAMLPFRALELVIDRYFGR
jgi:NAD(P)-dependent dehydrogenase (short-subunit alcohol dehydrogenase family)